MIKKMIFTPKSEKTQKPSTQSLSLAYTGSATEDLLYNDVMDSVGRIFSKPLPIKNTFKKEDKKVPTATQTKKNMTETTEDQENILEDAALMKKVADGDPTACRMAIDKHSSHIYRVAYRVLHQQGEAEDVVQESFIKLWQIAPNWKPQAKILTWLYRVAMNAALDKVRKRPLAREVNLELYMPFAPATNSAEDFVKTEENQQYILTLHRALQNLPKRYQMILNLCYFENLKVREAAAILKLSSRAAESLLKRARGRLKLVYQKEALTNLA